MLRVVRSEPISAQCIVGLLNFLLFVEYLKINFIDCDGIYGIGVSRSALLLLRMLVYNNVHICKCCLVWARIRGWCPSKHVYTEPSQTSITWTAQHF